MISSVREGKDQLRERVLDLIFHSLVAHTLLPTQDHHHQDCYHCTLILCIGSHITGTTCETYTGTNKHCRLSLRLHHYMLLAVVLPLWMLLTIILLYWMIYFMTFCQYIKKMWKQVKFGYVFKFCKPLVGSKTFSDKTFKY